MMASLIATEQDTCSTLCNIPGKVDRLDILKLDRNWRLVDERDAPLQ